MRNTKAWLQPRAAIGTFSEKVQTPPEIFLLRALDAEDMITSEVSKACPDAVSWSTSATEVHNGFVFNGPITVNFAAGSLIITPHPLDDHLYNHALAELTGRQEGREVFVDLTSSESAGPANKRLRSVA